MKIVIVGTGTASWISAFVLSHTTNNEKLLFDFDKYQKERSDKFFSFQHFIALNNENIKTLYQQ